MIGIKVRYQGVLEFTAARIARSGSMFLFGKKVLDEGALGLEMNVIPTKVAGMNDDA